MEGYILKTQSFKFKIGINNDDNNNNNNIQFVVMYFIFLVV